MFRKRNVNKTVQRVFTREISSHDEPRPGMKSSPYMVKCPYCLHIFAEIKFHPGMKDRDEISFRDEKKKKRPVKT